MKTLTAEIEGVVERLGAIDLLHMNGLKRALDYRETIDQAASLLKLLLNQNANITLLNKEL